MYLSDLHRYDPAKKAWSILGNAVDEKGNVSTFMASPAFYVPPHHLLMVGSSDHHLMAYIENVGQRLELTEDPTEKADCKKLIDLTIQNFPGYSRNVMAFDMRSSEWSRLGSFPDRPPVAAPVVPWQGGLILPCGETGPGKRSNKIWECRVKKKARIVE
jgi:N-acetylneuraminic acid mutarotase